MQLISSFLYDLTVLKSAELASWWTLLHRHTAPSPLSFNWAHKTISPWWKCQPNVQWQRKGVQDLLPQIGIFKNVLFISKSWTFWIQKSSPCILSSWECLRGKSLLSSPNDSWHTQAEREKSAVVSPILLWISSPGMLCCNPSYLNATICYLFLFAVLPQSGVKILGMYFAI